MGAFLVLGEVELVLGDVLLNRGPGARALVRIHGTCKVFSGVGNLGMI